jgi:hypothetical protein
MRWMGHVAHNRERRDAYRFLVRNLSKRDYVDDLGIDRNIG